MKFVLTDDFINVKNFNRDDIHAYINFLLNHDDVYILSSSFIKKIYIRKYLDYFNLSKKKILSKNNITVNDTLIHFWFQDNFDFSILNDLFCKKIFHLMDYWLNSSYKKKILNKYKVDNIISYSNSDIHDQFFINHYSSFKNKVISLPFGYNKRFINLNLKRKEKCLLLGSINPVFEVDQIIKSPKDLKKNREFYDFSIINEYSWFHQKRRDALKIFNKDYFVSFLPEYPTIKRYDYDIIRIFNEYRFFYCCESILNFPPAKIYEGMACGCIPVLPDIDIYNEIGLINNYNVIFFYPNNVNIMMEKVLDLLSNLNIDKLNNISINCIDFAKNNFSHQILADKLIKKL